MAAPAGVFSAAGLPETLDPALALLALIRILYDTPEPADDWAALAGVNGHRGGGGELGLPLPLPPPIFEGILDGPARGPDGLFRAIVNDRRASLLYTGLMAMDAETRGFLASLPELVRELADRAGVVAAFGRSVRVATVGDDAAVRHRAAPGCRGPAPSGVEGADAAAIPPFRTEDVLAPQVVNPFIDHVIAEYSPSAAARDALEAIRAGNLQDATKGTREIGDLGLAFAQGLSLLAANRPKEADAYFRAALRQSSDFIGAAFYLGATLAAAGRDRDAVGAWQTALIGEVGAAGIYPVLIDGLLRLGEAEDALEFLKESEPTFADRSGYTRRLVQASALAARYGEARPLVHEYLAAHPGDLDMLFMAMHLIYEGHAGGGLADEAAELARFKEYAARYEARKGPQALVVQGWRKALGIR